MVQSHCEDVRVGWRAGFGSRVKSARRPQKHADENDKVVYRRDGLIGRPFVRLPVFGRRKECVPKSAIVPPGVSGGTQPGRTRCRGGVNFAVLLIG